MPRELNGQRHSVFLTSDATGYDDEDQLIHTATMPQARELFHVEISFSFFKR